MSGESDLNRLLGSMEPKLQAGQYVFVTTDRSSLTDIARYQPIGTFVEAEGLSAILPLTEDVQADFNFDGVFRCITLNVHSSLDAVGLTAAVSTALTMHNISANVVAAYYHDHIFVNEKDAQQAVQCLLDVSEHHK